MHWDKNYRVPRVINDPQVLPAYGVTDVERAYWNSKQDALEYDAEPTAFSDKHLISGAIYVALQQYKTDTVRICKDYYNTETSRLERAVEQCVAAIAEVQQEVQDAEQAARDAASSALSAQQDASNAELQAGNALVSAENASIAAAEAAEYARRLSLAWFTEDSGEIYINWEE